MIREYQVTASPKTTTFQMTEAYLSHVPDMGASALFCSVWPCGGASVSGLGLTLSLFMGIGLEKQLIQRFKTTFKNSLSNSTPNWAWDFKPPIPLIGKNYKPCKSLLIYASAENLSWLHSTEIPSRFSGDKAYNRYQTRYEETGKQSDTFFPDVGIQPVTDGGLFVAGMFASQKHNLPVRVTPRSFLEQITVSNWCKFIIKAKNNRDYINDVKKLTESLPFVVGELAELQPKVALVPKAIWKRPLLRAAMLGASPKTLFLPVPQFNATVINTHLKKYDHPATKLRQKYQGTPLATWMDNLKRLNKNHAWRYLAMLEATS